ncbi:acetylglutamate kinase [Clostridium sp. Marseille-Q2269]|uniref:acetylglutamate kinase n=1 Tax=Clostridium sp. Marseille-Q2269 TaxID=2942205 RepID=UPI0020734C7B|nr:acetylglutamate kinase [Clostridium sp. Marseille-Q2269]
MENYSKEIIRKMKRKIIVIKYGGSVIKNEKCKKAFLENVAYLRKVGINIVIVHGGGPSISKYLKENNIKTQFINGLRVTDKKTMEVVEMVLSGNINKELASTLCKLHVHALGISGRDCNLITAKKKYVYVNNEKIDIGYVGEVEKINTKFLKDIIKLGYIPVIAPIGTDEFKGTYNINADYAASAVSSALKAEKLVLMTDVEGVYLDINNKSSLLKQITVSDIKKYIKNGIIKGGMIPKMECCIQAIEQGTNSINLIDGRKENSLLLDVFEEGNCTAIV